METQGKVKKNCLVDYHDPGEMFLGPQIGIGQAWNLAEKEGSVL